MLKRKPGKILLERLLLLAIMVISHNAVAASVASFSADQTTGCLPLNVQFTSTSTNAVSWLWDLGNGNTSTLENPANLYTSQGLFTVTLIAYDASGNADTARYTNYITVQGKPTADFQAGTTTGCPDNNAILFTNNSAGGAVNYLWDFGDGTTSTLSNPIHSYNYSGLFTVTLIAMNGSGCQDIKIANQYITIYPRPDPTITVDDTLSCDPTTVFNFSNNAQFGSSWLWHFGDFTTSSQQNPSHVYPGPGYYQASLIVTNTYGCGDTTDVPILMSVGLTNWGSFTESTDSGCSPLSVTFVNNNANVASSFWSFGDGDTSNLISPTHIYNTGGSYTVSLIVTSTNGCSDTVVKNNLINVGSRPNVNFTYSNNSGCAPYPIQFTNTSTNFTSCLWFFGDGTTSTATNPVHTYTGSGTFDVTLQCWGPSGCTRSLVKNDIINITTPHAIYTANPRIGCPPLLTTFTTLTQSGGLTYLWNFGDGGSSTLANPTHNYTASGNFDVTLIVTDSLGCTETITKSNFVQTVNPAASYIPPPVTSGCAPLTAQFTDATVGSVAWSWNFGDGFTSSLQNPTHTYFTPGIYTVSLTTTSAGGGCSQTISNFSTFDVNGGYAGFTLNASQCPPYIATFQDTSLNAVSWLWDFGDGTTSTSQNPSHTYSLPGYHSVSLNIVTADGCSYTTMQSNGVYFAPFGANFYGVPLDTIFPIPVQWFANSVGATSWLWDFGDSTTSTLEDPLHIFQYPSTPNVTLTISNGICSILYNPPPYLFGSPDSTHINTGHGPGIDLQQGCAPLNVLFTNTIAGSSSWLWDFGDGNTSTLQFPFHTYPDPGVYSVTLTTSDTSGIVQVLQLDSIVRVSGPQPGFGILQTPNCSNTQITISDTSVNAVQWRWNLGDGTIDTVQNPLHIYSSSLPNYIITQTVTDTMGCTASISTSIFASFVSPLLASESELCGYDTVAFFTSLQNYTTYLWDFGDGQTSNLMSPSHLYTTEGVFQVSLTVTDISGCTQTFYVNPSITVRLPIASFSTIGSRQACNEIDIHFLNNSSNADSYLWDLGDGNFSSLFEPLHTYSQAGVYDVSLTVYRGSCVDTISFQQYIKVDTSHADFVYSTNQICIPVVTSFHDMSSNAVSWRWYFGDGDSASVQNPVHTYTFRPCCYPYLITTDINGCVDTALSSSFPVMKAIYSTSADSGCFPFTVHFTNLSSLIVDTWYWDFGDGTTSTDPSPSHTYAQPGVYDVMLIVKSFWANCTDTLFNPGKIKVRQPHADFFSSDLSACAPSLANFTDLSTDADSYLWDFGDGTTSTNVNPSHIFNIPGNYTVKLVTTSNLGCSDSLSKPHYILVRGPITNFSSSTLDGCAPLDVTFTDHSINAVTYSWNFGDGSTDFTINPSHTFTDTGSFAISLVTQDTSGCTSYYELPQPVLIHPVPNSSFTADSMSGCQPFTTGFTNTSTGNIYSTWHFGDGDTTSAINPNHTFLTPGNFDVQLVSFNQFGCSDTAHLSQPLLVNPTPVPSFTVTDAVGCSPFHVTFINNSTNLDGPQYFWDFGNGNTSTDANPSFDFTEPGSHDVGVTITNASGCSAYANYPSMINVLDTVPPNETKILSVSVVSNSSVRIIWENNPAIDLAAYVIYRLNPATNSYQSIYMQTNVQNTGFALTSEYDDPGLNTLLNTYTYKIQALDICGNTIPLEQSIAHTTVNVSSYRVGTNIRVNWTPYGGCPVSSYELYRARPGDPFVYLRTLPPDSLTYLDTTFVCPLPYSYKVMATDLCGNTYTSYSDTSVTIPLNILDGQIVDVVRSSVVDNDYVLTEWQQPVVHPEMVEQFDIYRSTDNTNFYYVVSVPSLQTDYKDHNVDVQNEHYFYKILVINTCDIAEDMSDFTSTIILKGEMNEARQVHLGWTPYEGWDSGVEYYIIEMKDENGSWQLLRQVDGHTLKFDYQE